MLPAARPAGPDTVVLVGAGPGLGLAIARRFAREGAAVALLARSADRLGELADAVRDAGGAAHPVAVDVADPAALRRALAAARSALGDPTVLVHHVSVPVPGTPTTMAYAAFAAGFAAGVGALQVAAAELTPAMRAAGRGSVLVTGSGLAFTPAADVAGLAVQKAAVRSFALALAAELAPAGVHVATVTIEGILRPGTHFDPDRIAEVYWQLHTEPPPAWRSEVRYRRPAAED